MTFWHNAGRADDTSVTEWNYAVASRRGDALAAAAKALLDAMDWPALPRAHALELRALGAEVIAWEHWREHEERRPGAENDTM